MSGPRALTNAQAARARRRYHAGGVTQSELAREHGVSHAAMGCLLRGESYRDAGGPVGTRGQPGRSRVDVGEARRLRAQGWTLRALGERYGVSAPAVARALR